MSSLLSTINDRLSALPPCFEPLREMVLRYLASGYCIYENCIRVGRFRKYDKDHYHITIFPPANSPWLVARRSFEVPIEYLKFLSYSNGLQLFELSLFGFTPGMQQTPPKLDRTRLQSLDLTLANESWLVEVKNPPVGCIYFGCSPYNYEQNMLYFMDEAGSVRALLKDGRSLRQWPSFWQFLADQGAAEEQSLLHQARDPVIAGGLNSDETKE
jgi:hypothetical protein